MKKSTRQMRRLLVIYPERRGTRRYVTLKNGAIAGILVVVGFTAVSVWSAFRPDSHLSGNLFRPRVPTDSIASRRDPIVIHEGSIDARPETNAVLLDVGAVDQLRAPAAPLPVAPAPAMTAEELNFEHRTSQLGKGKRITISGGSDGVQVHAESQPTSPPR